MLYCLIKTPASLHALDMILLGCLLARVCECEPFKSPSSHQHFALSSQRFHLARFIAVLLKTCAFDPVYNQQQQQPNNLKL